MKILHILDHSVPLHSGYSFRSENILREQRRRGWHPVIVTSPKHEESWHGPWNAREEINGFAYYRTGVKSTNSFQIYGMIKVIVSLAKRLEEVAKIEKPDILHPHSPVLNGISALLVGRRLNIPVVYEIRAFWEDAGVDHKTYRANSKKYKLVRATETWVCRKVSHVAILCSALKKDLVARGIPSGKITPVLNGIDPDCFKPIEPNEEFLSNWKLAGKKVIGFIGSFYRYEGLDLLVDTFSRIASNDFQTILLLVGGGDIEREIREQIQRLDLDDRVVMTGRISHERIAEIYALVDILVYPRHRNRLTELVTPLKPLEAMATGKPVVASDVGGHRELIQHNENGLLFSAGNSSALEATLNTLLKDGALRLQLGSKAKIWVREKHTWDRTTSVYQEIYTKATALYKVSNHNR